MVGRSAAIAGPTTFSKHVGTFSKMLTNISRKMFDPTFLSTQMLGQLFQKICWLTFL
jgi:hypothetical protein